jgi:hypothetical protein
VVEIMDQTGPVTFPHHYKLDWTFDQALNSMGIVRFERGIRQSRNFQTVLELFALKEEHRFDWAFANTLFFILCTTTSTLSTVTRV